MDDLIEQIVDNWDDNSRGKADNAFWKEIDSHPAFATDLDSNAGNLAPDIESMQAIQYDDDENEETVLNYKNEGNYYYRKQNYTLAIVNYSKGLKLNVDDKEMNCILYTNRAACYFHQENYRKCIKDCIMAIKMNPVFIKAYWRAANSAAKIDKCDEVLEYCVKGLEICPDNKDLLALKEKFTERKMKKEETEKMQLKSPQLLIVENRLKERGVIVADDISIVEIPAVHMTHAFVDKSNLIHFNVLILYPEFGQTDFLQDVQETATILDCLQSIFSPREKSVDWDIEGNYTIYTPQLQMALQAYYENKYEEMVRFNLKSPIRDLIKMNQFRLRSDLVIEVNVVSKMSDKFLSSWKKVTSPNDLD